MIQPFWRYISKSYSLCPSLLIPDPTTDLLDNHIAEGEETGGSEGDEEPQHGNVPRTPARHGRDSHEIRAVLLLPD